MNDIKISAVVNCYNEEIWIESSIRSLVGLVDEILVFDNCSTDRTGEIVGSVDREFGKESPIRYIRADEPKQLANARNFAMDSAIGDWILKWDGDFVAYNKPEKHDFVRGMNELTESIRAGKFEDFDVILLHSLNVSGDVFHYDSRRQYLGLHGDSFIIKRGRVRYVSDDRYPDTGIIRGEDGGPASMYRINKPGDPMYFLHMFGVKEDSYHLYRAFMVDYQKAITAGFVGSFDDWYGENRSGQKEDGENYARQQMLKHLLPHKLPLPGVVSKNPDLVGMFSLIYKDGVPISRSPSTN